MVHGPAPTTPLMSRRPAVVREAVSLFARTSRGEILGTLVIALALGAAAVFGMTVAAGTGQCPGCGPSTGSTSIDREVIGPLVLGLMLGIAVMGPLLGVSVVGPEIERGTAQLGWSLMSRRRWLAFKALPPAAWGLLLIVPVATLITILAAMRHPGASVADDYGSIGLLPVLRLTFTWSIGLLAGVLIGRSMAALVASVTISITFMALLVFAWPFGVPAAPYADGIPPGARAVGQRYRADDGALLTEGEAEARAPDSVTRTQMGEWLGANFVAIDLAITPEQLGEVELRESIGLVAATATLVMASLVLIQRRRPT